MTKRLKEDQSTEKQSEVPEHLKRLLEKGKEVPHPGTFRVRILPNPRVNKRVPNKR